MKTSYRNDIDGLRALAVLLVIGCHAGFKLFAGGFVGVDVFFVISGYVVTISIQAGLAEGRFSFSEFYTRRAKRLVPALYTVMLSTFVFGVLFLVPDAAYSIVKNISAVTLFASNIYIASLTGYFDPSAENLPLLHTWSLSVEEQFYLVLPLLLFLIRKQTAQRKLFVTSFLLAASLVASEWAVFSGGAGSYYLFQYRIFEFMMGVIAAMLPVYVLTPRVSNAIQLAGISLVVGSALSMNAMTPFPGLLAVLPCLGAMAIILSGQSSFAGRLVFGNPVAVRIGKWSYSLYLWHWPVFFAFRHFNLISLSETMAAIALSFLLTAATYRYIEQPLRVMKMPTKKAALIFIGAPFIVIICLSATGRLSQNFLFLYPSKFQQIYKVLAVSRHDSRSSFAQKELALPVDAVFGDAKGKTTAVIWGDSHALSFRFFFDSLGKEFNLAMVDMSLPGCPPVSFPLELAIPPSEKRIPEKASVCKQNNQNVMNTILFHDEIKIVFISGRWLTYKDAWIRFDGVHDVFSSEQVKRSLFATIQQLQKAGKKVVLVDDLPEIPAALKDCVISRDTWFGGNNSCSFPVTDALTPYSDTIAPMLAELHSAFPSMTIMHTYDVLCDANLCHMEINGRQVYQVDDTNHLALSAGNIFYAAYRRGHPADLVRLFGDRPDLAN